MWWIAAALLTLLVFLLWPRPARIFMACASAANHALKTRDWTLFDERLEAAMKAAAKLRDASQRAEGESACHLMAGEAFYRRGDFERAEKELAAAVEKLEQVESPHRAFKLKHARHLWGDLHYDLGELDQAEEQFRAAFRTMTQQQNPAAAVFSLQRLCDVLLEKGDYYEARETALKCVELERSILDRASKGKAAAQISMTAPDLALASREFERAEQLFRQKVDHWSNLYPRPDNIDVNRYQFHLAEAQQGQGNFTEAFRTLEKALETAELDFGAEHPRATLARQKLERARMLAGEEVMEEACEADDPVSE